MQFIFIIILGIIVSGCASNRENMVLSDKFKANPGSVLVTEISGFENPIYHVEEAQASNSGSILLDALVSVASSAINSSSSTAGREAVACIDAEPILEDDYFKPFMLSLQSKGFNPQKGNTIKTAELKEYESKEEKYAPYDFRFLKDRYGTKYALVLEPHFFGAKHAGTFCNPIASTTIVIYAIDLESNNLEGYFKTAVEIKMQDNWEEKDYQGFIKTTVEALEKALKQAHDFLFAEKQKI
jgi:hypothetical protein